MLYNRLSFPINDHNTHWVGVYVDLLGHTITYRDSLGAADDPRIKTVQLFLSDELHWRAQRHTLDPTDPEGLPPIG